MSEQKWTKEPWTLKEHASVTGCDYLQILSGSWDIAHNKFSARDWEEERANAARIVACVNACQGIPDPAAFVLDALDARRVLGMWMSSFQQDARAPLVETHELLARMSRKDTPDAD